MDNSPLSDASFANSFSQSVACLFIVLTVSFPEQKILIVKESSLSTLAFQESCVGGVGKKSLPNPRLSRFLPVLSSRSIMVSCFPLRPGFQLESALAKCVTAGSGLVASGRDAQRSSPIPQGLFLLPFIAFAPLSESR